MQTLTMDVSLVVYTLAIVSLLGWFLFVIFGGVGITALPLDLFHEFRTRP